MNSVGEIREQEEQTAEHTKKQDTARGESRKRNRNQDGGGLLTRWAAGISGIEATASLETGCAATEEKVRS